MIKSQNIFSFIKTLQKKKILENVINNNLAINIDNDSSIAN